ncbi:Rtg2 protein [Saccharomycopsis crataegensis]|uniref:Rtg2 protein n=1 Tax=Saccharomycopsis crataegensis TaxID=43959 RepID=A0AAV5QJG6_9ASCO|nr:Rtg2 protein [Saccharomycopsis crataegensis]
MSAILSDDEEFSQSPLMIKNLSMNNTSGQKHEEADIVGKSLVGVVDCGSNGVRFAITSVAPHHARTMPCVFKDRLNVSLFDAQYENGNCKINEKSPIPNEVIYEICKAMKRFQMICDDFGVDDKSVRVVATEATREASNSKYFRECIKQTTGWDVELLSKEAEGRIGAYGVVSSFHVIQGLFLDLGGGSTQLNWIYCEENGDVEFSKKPISLPYGAAALTRRLKTENQRDLFFEIKDAYAKAIKMLDIPQKLIEKAHKEGGFQLFCSGGGLRGLGNLLLSQNPEYPITAVINGYACEDTEITSLANFLFLKNRVPDPKANIFRVSERRKQQFPAIGLLVSAAFESLPKIRSIHFSQGGVREGSLFEKLPKKIRSQDPLIVATKPYAPFLVDKYLNLLRSAIPREHVPREVYERVAPALCNLAFVHTMYPKELQPTAALQVATTGIIAGSHGLSHRIRALIGIALCERWGAELPENQAKFKNNLISTVLKGSISSDSDKSSEDVFWTIYIGKIMFFICGIHPGGNINEANAPFEFEVKTKEIKDDSEASNKDEEKQTTAANKKYKFETIVRIDSDNLKIGSGAGNRIKSITKKIKKLSKSYNIKMKFDIQSVNHSINIEKTLKHGEREEEDDEE